MTQTLTRHEIIARVASYDEDGYWDVKFVQHQMDELLLEAMGRWLGAAPVAVAALNYI